MSAEPADDNITVSYQPRVTLFESDASESQLGEPNESAEDYNRQNVHRRTLGDLAVLANLERVQYGSWKGEKACLLCLRFQFQKGTHQTFRFEKADIIIELKSRHSKSPNDDPAIRDYGPKHIRVFEPDEILPVPFNAYHGNTASEQAHQHNGHVYNNSSVSYTMNVTGTQPYRSEIGCDDHRSRKHKSPNCIKMWMKENKELEHPKGIPNEVSAAIIFTYKGDCQAQVTVKTDRVFHLLAAPWTKDDPILFREGITFGESVDKDFESLDQIEWCRLLAPRFKQNGQLHWLSAIRS